MYSFVIVSSMVNWRKKLEFEFYSTHQKRYDFINLIDIKRSLKNNIELYKNVYRIKTHYYKTDK